MQTDDVTPSDPNKAPWIMRVDGDERLLNPGEPESPLDPIELELPADVKDLASQLTPRQFRYAIHYMVHADRKAAFLYAGYKPSCTGYMVDPTFQVNRPVVTQFMKRVRDYYTGVGLWTHIELRLILQRVIEGELQLDETQQWAVDSLRHILEKLDDATTGMEKDMSKLIVEHTFRHPALTHHASAETKAAMEPAPETNLFRQ